MKKQSFLVSCILLLTSALYAGNGTLDLTFGINGIIDVPAGNPSAIAVQTDGKIVVLAIDPTYTFFQTIRYNTNGSIDGTFGTNGIVIASQPAYPSSLVIQPDGKIVVVGTDHSDNNILIRYNSDGTLDTSFGVGGIVEDVPGYIGDVALETSGTIIVVGAAGENFFVARYNTDGTLNTVFPTSVLGFGYAVILQNDGNIVVAGQTLPGFFQIVRYLPSGTLDSSFGTGGVATGPLGIGTSVVVQPNGQLLVGGFGATYPNNVFQVTRFNTNGTIDPTYGTAGTVMVPTGAGYSLRLQADNKAILAGQTNGENANYEVARYATTGTVDSSFGSGLGYVTIPVGAGYAAAIQADGKLLVVGVDNSDSETPNIQLVRYLMDPAILPTQIITPANGSGILQGTANFTGTAQNPSNVYILLDGAIIGAVATGPGATNSWSFSTVLTPGTYTAQAVSLYSDGRVNLASPEISFDVAETLLSATKTDSTGGENVRNCSTLTYTITVTNTGPVQANKVVVTDMLPTGVTFVTASTSNGKSVSQSGGTVTTSLGNLDLDETETVTITVQVKASVIGSLVNTAIVSGLNTQTLSLTDTIVIAQSCATNCIIACPE
jgi:uncharacterized delta-60 repeat protein/uncharacterized repeat protein (TIGR01451 family)